MAKAEASYAYWVLQKQRIEQLEAQLQRHGIEPEPTPEVPRWNPNLFERVDMCFLSTRSQKCLAHAGIEFVYELAECTSSDLLNLGKFGIKSYREIEEFLAELGLHLGMVLGEDFPRKGTFSRQPPATFKRHPL